jgi:uncharacterized protein involved in cysteine biosynthesis
MKKFTYLITALAVIQVCVVIKLVYTSITAYQTGYFDAIHSAELVEMDASGYAIRYGADDNFQVHEYTFKEATNG